MGRDYSYWTGKRARGGGSGSGSGSGGDTTPSSGCMSSVFRFLDFHNFQLCHSLSHLNHHHHADPETLDPHSSPSLPQESLKAPRNSFESAPSISEPRDLDNLSIPQVSPEIIQLTNIQIKTTRSAGNIQLQSSNEELSEDSLSSPGARTPSLVARLMGLDLLPESISPANSATSAKLQTQPTRKAVKSSGTQSLPDSPRTSLARLSDVDLHHRLSLQVSKESNGKGDETLKRREMIKTLVKNSETEGWSPSHYAKQIVKQVKENAGRRVGLAEITNTIRNRKTEQRRDEHLLARPKTPPLRSKMTNLKCGESENRLLPTSSTPEKTKTVQVEKIKCRKAEEDRFKFTSKLGKASSSTVKIPLKSKKTPVSTEQFKIHPAMRTNLSRIKQVGSRQSQRRNSELQKTHIYVQAEEASTAKAETVNGPEEIHYVGKILKCMGIGNHTRVTIHNCPSPLNPIIFNLLEPKSSSSQTIIKSNRRLIFQLTEEILADILRPASSSYAVRCGRGMMNGAELLKLLIEKMGSFPLSNCQDLEDVDALVGLDYRAEAADDERDSVVLDIEREILDCLLTETASLGPLGQYT